MYLTPTSLIPYLIGRGLVGSESVVRGDLQIAELERNNRCFKVISRHGPSYFVKQVRLLDESTTAGLRREAMVYRLAASNPQFQPLCDLLPRFVAFDERRHAVIVEFLPNSENAHQFHNRAGSYPVEIGRLLGASLGAVHSELGRQFAAQISDAVFQRRPPWILSFHRDQGDGQLSPANQQLLKLLQGDSEMQQILDRLLTQWQFDGLMHRDLKWNNILLVPVESNTLDALSLRIIDWELSDLGDCCWDTGMMLQNWWSFQALAAPAGSPIEAEEFVNHDSCGLGAVHSAVREFWSAWISSVDIPARSDSRVVEKCVLYAAARLLQTAYEMLHPASKIGDRELRLFRLSQYVMKNPNIAIGWLTDTMGN